MLQLRDELELTQEVEIRGHTVQGKKTYVILSPNPKRNGWVWETGQERVAITPQIMVPLRRRVALRHERSIFNEFEHLGILRAAGLQHVRLWCPGAWPPYDGGSLAIWNQVMPYTRKSGVLHPYRFVFRSPLDIFYRLPSDPTRYAVYSGDGREHGVLDLTFYVNYPGLGEQRYRFEHGKDDLKPLVEARTLGWPPILRHVSRAAGASSWLLRLFRRQWPHHNRIVWPGSGTAEEVLGEAIRHRALDALAILNFAAPTGTYLSGKFHSVKGNHATDLGLLHKLLGTNVISLNSRKEVA